MLNSLPTIQEMVGLSGIMYAVLSIHCSKNILVFCIIGKDGEIPPTKILLQCLALQLREEGSNNNNGILNLR